MTSAVTEVVVPDEMNDHPVSMAISLFWDGGDPWGSAMREGFALCDFVTFELGDGSMVPAELGYQPAMAGPDRDDPIFEYLIECYAADEFTAEDAHTYLPILHRFLDRCRAAGRDY